MTQTRRTFLATSGAAITLLPFAAAADGHEANTFDTPNGLLSVHPIRHASFVLIQGDTVIYVDPVGDASEYDGLPAPTTILITHEHGDHFDRTTLANIAPDGTFILCNPAVLDKLSDTQRGNAVALENGGSLTLSRPHIFAIPAYNTTQGRTQFHPQGRDNGYVLDFDGFRVYISGDTEDIPEMRALENIDIAFVCMNLPFTMDAEAAASAVAEFAPTYVYPYHFHGRALGTQDPSAFADMVPDGIEVKLADWYS